MGKINSSLKICCGKKKYKFVMKKTEAISISALIKDLLEVVTVSNKDINDYSYDQNVDDILEDEEILSSKDWDTILTGSGSGGCNSTSLMTFSKGDVILEEGKNYMMVCQIASGECRIEKNVPESDMSIVLGPMRSGE